MHPVEEQTTKPDSAPRRARGAARAPGVKPGTPRLVGTLIRIHQDGYGFIQTAQGEFFINIGSMRDRAAWIPNQVLSFLPGAPREGKATPAYDAIALKP
jgi:hypothetical protein